MNPRINRIIELDALRGFALIGILIMNMYSFNMYYGSMYVFYSAFTGLNSEIYQQVLFFVGGKFMFIFAFLFGYGAWLQFDKHEKNDTFKGFWFRRMTILFCIGILHILLLNYGDILAAYALLGMTIPYFIKKSNKTLIILLIVLQLIPAFEYALRKFLEYPYFYDVSKYSIDEYIQINGSANLWELMQLRLYDFFTFRNEKLIFYMPKELSLFLLGIICAKKNLIKKCYSKKGIIFCAMSTILVVVYYLYEEPFELLFNKEEPVQAIIYFVLNLAKENIQGLLYVFGFVALWNLNLFSKSFSFLKYSGRMALTNYIMQSLICFFIFSGFGFGLYGTLSPSELLLFSLYILSFQWFFSYLWLKKYQFGPMEWVWRRLTYKKTIANKTFT
jgi:uncharacterized protein